MRKMLSLLLLLCISLSLPYIPAQGAAAFTNYRTIPGVTQAEIDAIETFKTDGRSFVYGSIPSTEAFLNENEQLSGFTVELCQLLSQLFDIPFVPSVYEWDSLIQGLENKSIDFSGDFTITPERKKTYFMSDAIAVRSLALFYPTGSKMLAEITAERTPTLGFFSGTIHESQFAESYPGNYHPFYRDTLPELIDALNAGEIDTIITDNVAEASLEDGSGILCKAYSPLICHSVALSTQNEALAPILSVFDKYIRNGGQDELAVKYAKGLSAYTRFVVRKNFTTEEKNYIDGYVETQEKIPIILESGNYPISFYNKKYKEYQGIVPDLLKRVTELTGLEFEVVNTPEENWATVLARLQNGEAKLISELLFTESRQNQFLWPDDPSCITHYALLSRNELPNLSIYQLLGKRIGVEVNTAYHDFAIQWFPNAELLTYLSIDDAFLLWTKVRST